MDYTILGLDPAFVGFLATYALDKTVCEGYRAALDTRRVARLIIDPYVERLCQDKANQLERTCDNE